MNQHTTDELAKLEKDRIKKAEYQRLLNSLKYSRMNERRTQVASSHEKTFAWAYSGMTERDIEGEAEASIPDEKAAGLSLAHPLQEWLREPAAKLYWISGKPGSGKSTFMKFLVGNERTKEELRAPGKDVQILSHFFWVGGHELQRNVRGMELSLLDQLLDDADHKLTERLLHQFEFLRKKHEDTDWSREELEKTLIAACKMSSSSICIFLDGLDEVLLEDRRGPASIMMLVKQLCGLGKVKICASSRPESDLQLFFEDEPHLRMQDLSHHDIRRYAEDSLRRLALVTSDVSSYDMKRLLDVICEHAAGVFLWVSLALKSLETGFVEFNTVDELSKRLELLPQELDKLYSDMWDRANAGENRKTYSEKAALFFTHALNLTHEAFNGNNGYFAWSTSQKHTYKGVFLNKIDVYRYISEPGLTARLLETGAWLAQAENEQSLRRTRRDIEIRTAGLLHIIGNDEGSRVDFVHRSAIDFLKDTAKGKEIRTHPDPAITPAVVLAQAMRAVLVLTLDAGASGFEKVWTNEMNLLKYLDAISTLHSENLLDTKTTTSLLATRERFYDRVRYQNRDVILEHHNYQLPMDFAGSCLACGFPPEVLSKLPGLARLGGHGRLSSSYALYLLQLACQCFWHLDTRRHDGATPESLEWLIKAVHVDYKDQPGPGHRDIHRIPAAELMSVGWPPSATWSHFAIDTAVFRLLQNTLMFSFNRRKTLLAIVQRLKLNIDRGNTSLVICRLKSPAAASWYGYRAIELGFPIAWRDTLRSASLQCLPYGTSETTRLMDVVLEVDVRFYLQLVMISELKHHAVDFKDTEDDLNKLNKSATHNHRCAKVLAIAEVHQDKVLNKYSRRWMPDKAEAWKELSRAFQPDGGEWKAVGQGITLGRAMPSFEFHVPELPLLPYLDHERMPGACKEVSDEEINQMLCDKGLAMRREDVVWRPSVDSDTVFEDRSKVEGWWEGGGRREDE